MNTGVMFSSKSMNWATPQDFFDKLNSEFHFTLDPSKTECRNSVYSWTIKVRRWKELRPVPKYGGYIQI